MTGTIIARNAPCPCGSGRRYKDCHGAIGRRAEEAATADSLLREAQVAFAAGNSATAYELIRRAFDLSPGRADLLRERARIEWTRGETSAVATCRAAVERAPDDLAAWNLLGEILHSSDAAAAEVAWRRALEIDPRDAEALFHLGNREREKGDSDAAIALYERALETSPDHPGVLNNLGLALEASGKIDRAETCYRQVLAFQAQHADALANLANLLHGRGHHREAALAYEKAIQSRREFPARFWVSRGVTLGELGAFVDAEASFREAARIDPASARIQIDLGSLCVLQGKFEEAEAPLAHALEIDRDNVYAKTMLAYARMQRCDWRNLDATFRELRTIVADDRPRRARNLVPFPLLAMPLGPEIELAAARRMAQQLAASHSSRPVPPERARAPGQRLRVGFVSSDFREHPITYLIAECCERLDRARVETFGYSLVPEEQSAAARRIERAFDHFAIVAGLPVETIAQRIGADGIDILFDLNGYTTHSKSEIFVSRPAPIQVSWLGYLGTLGAEWYDYVLTDRFACPPPLQRYFTERFLYLPDCYCPSDTARPVAAEAPSRGECGLPSEGFVFCCFNNGYKILPQVFDVWTRLLAAAPGSVLWLAPGNAAAIDNLRREATARGVDPQRLVFAERIDLPRHLARHAHADLFLDTTPYNAGTAANDALFMGVPVVTCTGETMASRVAGSQLRAIGLPELVRSNLADYEALALALARDPARLGECRERLRAHRHTHPLFDMARFARSLDDVLHEAWENRPVSR